MVSFIDTHRDQYGVEPICSQLPIAPSTYYLYKTRDLDTTKSYARHQRDQVLLPQIKRVWEENYLVYGARKIRRQLNREEVGVARCTVERLMRQLGIQGVVRGRKRVTTRSNPDQKRELDLVRQ